MEQAINEAQELIVVDEESMTLINTVTGEVVGYSETPPGEVDDIWLAEWIGEKVAGHNAAAAGLKAEKQVWIDTINARFDGRIKSHENAATFLRAHWHDRLLGLAKRLIGDGKKRSVACGLLLLRLKKSSAKMEIVDAEQAVTWCKFGYPDALKTVTTVLVSKIDPVILVQAEEALGKKSGMVFHPAGEREDLVVE